MSPSKTLALAVSTVLAGSAFVVSLVVDQLVSGAESGNRMLLEHGAKFLGVLAWALYFVRTAADIVSSIARKATEVNPQPFPEASSPGMGRAPRTPAS